MNLIQTKETGQPSKRTKRSKRPNGVLKLVTPQSTAQWIGLSLIAVFVTAALAAPIISPFDPLQTNIGPLLSPPDATHWLGTDQLGRDMLSRLIHGARVTLPLGVITVALALAVGVPWGVVAGYFGGWVDQALMRVADLALAFPSLVLALAVAGAMGAGPEAAVIGVAIAFVPRYARLVRGEVLSVREREYVLADRGFGTHPAATLLGTVLPNAMRPVYTVAVLDMGLATIAAATLSFLGLGARPPIPEWGAMTSIGLTYPAEWWLSVPAGLSLVIFIIAINLYATPPERKGFNWRKLR